MKSGFISTMIFMLVILSGCGSSTDSSNSVQDSTENNSNSNSTTTNKAGKSDIDFRSADGNVWLNLSPTEKTEMIEDVIVAIKIAHNDEVTVGPEYFVEALDAFYGGTEENKQSVVEMVVLTGASGGVIIQK